MPFGRRRFLAFMSLAVTAVLPERVLAQGAPSQDAMGRMPPPPRPEGMADNPNDVSRFDIGSWVVSSIGSQSRAIVADALRRVHGGNPHV